MRVVLLITLLSYSLVAQDFWQKDKQKHFLASATIAGTTTALAKHCGSNSFEAFWVGVGSTLVIGTVKEYLDGKNPLFHTEDINDVYADMDGAIVGSLIFVQFSWEF